MRRRDRWGRSDLIVGNSSRAAPPAEDDLDREIEYAFDPDEPMLGRPPAGDVE
jgi:hypothetical protein